MKRNQRIDDLLVKVRFAMGAARKAKIREHQAATTSQRTSSTMDEEAIDPYFAPKAVDYADPRTRAMLRTNSGTSPLGQLSCRTIAKAKLSLLRHPFQSYEAYEFGRRLAARSEEILQAWLEWQEERNDSLQPLDPIPIDAPTLELSGIEERDFGLETHIPAHLLTRISSKRSHRHSS
jgi:hypothetical protein